MNKVMERVPPGKLYWRRHPNGGKDAIVAVPKDEAAGLLQLGSVKIEGERAVVRGVEQEEPHNTALRIIFDQPYPYPHP